MDADALARACADAMWRDDRASAGLGMRLESVGPGRARLSLAVGAAMVNGHGVCHGGFIFALADSSMAFASNSHGLHALAQQCAITFIRPAHLGETLTAEAVERMRGSRSGIYDVRVTGGDGAVVAEFRGHSRTTGQKFEMAEG
jgi:acyl-CoA thioesterase